VIKVHLSRILGEKQWSQAKLSRETGIRPSTINEIFHKVAERISFDQLDRICEALNCSAAELIEYIPNRRCKTGENLIVEEHGNQKKQPADRR